MADPTKYLKGEIARLKKEHDKELAPWVAALAAAEKSIGSSSANGLRHRSKNENGGGKRQTVSKIDFVMNHIEKHAKNGISPAEIKNLSPKEWTASKSYPYTQIWKLKEARYITEDQGRYFPGEEESVGAK